MNRPFPSVRRGVFFLGGSPRAVAARFGFALVLATAIVALPAASAQAQPSASEALSDGQFAALLAAGEFAPALQAAVRSPSGLRDERLARLSAAQSAAGASTASLATIGSIDDDQTRTAALGAARRAPMAALGGGSNADFDSLIDLITSTVATDSWLDNGGTGTISEFFTGVHVDVEGVLRKGARAETGDALSALRGLAPNDPRPSGDVHRESPLRRISLNRLERAVQLRAAAGLPPTEEMRLMAGMHRVRYVFVYPETGDIVLAGPAGTWSPDGEGRLVHPESWRPVLHLEDFIVVLRHMQTSLGERLGCAITPTQEGLAAIQAFVAQSQQRPLPARGRAAWLASLGETLGRQDIEVYGIDPGTRAARVLVEADYRMKLVGMGLEEGVLGVESYLATIELGPGQAPPPLDVLRWWFTMHYDALQTTADRDAFELVGQGVRVKSENELLAEQGQRVHTGQSNVQNANFADSFTKHFEALCQRYPVYADLQNIFDLSLAAALVVREDLPGRVGWEATYFGAGEGDRYEVSLAAAPTQVATVVNHRVMRGNVILAGVSGGVHIDAAPLIAREAIASDHGEDLSASRRYRRPAGSRDVWWWDE
jgi:hypothetical protein